MRQIRKGLKKIKRLNQPSGKTIGSEHIQPNFLDLVHLFVHSANSYWKPGPDTTLDTEVTAGKIANDLSYGANV